MWRVIPGQSLAFREWDGEAVLYNDLSGSTHLLDGSAIDVLHALLPGPADTATLAARLAGQFDADPAALSAMIDDTLAALARLDLVECLRMLTVADLPPRALADRLAGPGLILRTGPFVNRIHSDISQLADGIALLYADYPVDEPGGFADFHLSLHRAGGLRRWFRPQVRFAHEGMTPFKPLPLAQAFPMFEWVMNWCVTHRAHAYLIIHAAVLERHGRAVVLPAPPGSGKSTLCAALVTRGWRLLSDEMTLVRLEDGAVLPLPRPVSLKNASIDVIRAFAPDAVLSPPVDNTAKGTIAHLKAPPASIEHAAALARPGFIVFPRYEAQAATSLTPLPKARAFMGVAENAFNYQVLGARGFTALGQLIESTTAFEFRYSRLDEAVALFERLAKDGA